MLKRRFFNTLCEWKNKKDRECLLVKGARQVGKTYIIDYFGKKMYSTYIYINFIEHPEHREIFEHGSDPEIIYKNIRLYVEGARLTDEDTLIFIDEIQACRSARTALKFLAIDNRYDVIGSGSLLGIHYKTRDEENSTQDNYSIPVGYEREIEMHSLDFEEYLWALGVDESTISLLFDYFQSKEAIPFAVNERFRRYILDYMVIGGLPDVVNKFIEHRDYKSAFDVQKKILAAYSADIEKYAQNSDIQKIQNIYNSIPRQLSKEYSKFQYKTVEKNGNKRKYENSIDWLIDAGMIKKVYNVSLPMMPLRGYEKPDEFKIYGTDIGLVTAMFGEEFQLALVRDDIKGPAKGGIYENLVFDILSKKEIYLNYYKKPENTQEIEFLYEKDSSVIPIEVKSKNGNTVSLNNFLDDFDTPYSYKLTSGNIGQRDKKITIPHYMAIFIS